MHERVLSALTVKVRWLSGAKASDARVSFDDFQVRLRIRTHRTLLLHWHSRPPLHAAATIPGDPTSLADAADASPRHLVASQCRCAVQRRGAEIPFAMRVFERVFPALDGGPSTHRPYSE